MSKYNDPASRAWAVTLPYIFLQITNWSFYAVVLSFSGNVLTVFDFTDGQISLFLGITAAISFGIQLLLGKITAKFPRITAATLLLLLGGLMLGGNVLVQYAVLPREIRIAAFGLVCTIVHLLPPLTNGIGMDAIKRGSSTNYSLARGMGSLGYSIYAYATGFLVRSFGSTMIFLVAGISALLLMLSTLWYHHSAVAPLPVVEDVRSSKEESASLLSRYPVFLAFLLGNVLLQLGHNLIGNFMFQIITAKGGTPAEQGIATAICAFVELPVMFGFPWLIRKVSCRTWVRLSALCILIKPLLILLTATSVGVYAAQASQMIGYGLFTISAVSYVEQLVAKGESLQAQNFLGASITAGTLLALFSGGFLCQYLGVQALALVSCLCAAAGGLIVFRSIKGTN